jgi:hypothetical protein
VTRRPAAPARTLYPASLRRRPDPADRTLVLTEIAVTAGVALAIIAVATCLATLGMVFLYLVSPALGLPQWHP